MISIITVVFNGETTIRDTIESVCRQTLLPTEYIIIDGASTDSTVDIVKHYMEKYSFIKLISEKDNGIYDAMNKGINLASGELIGIINSDDWYEQNALETMFNAYKSGGSGVYYGILRYLKGEDDFFLDRVGQKFVGEKMIPHPTTFVSKDVYIAYGTFSLKYKYSSDLEWVLRLVRKNVKFSHVDQIIANFRIGGASATFKAGVESLQIRRAYKNITTKAFMIGLLKLRLKHV